MEYSINTLKDGITGIGEGIANTIQEHPIATVAGASLVAAGAATGATLLIKHSSKKRKSKSKRKSRRSKNRDWRYISKQKHERAYQRRRRKLGKKTRGKYYKHRRKHHISHRKHRGGIHYTKNHQPYIILRSGKARFIKKRR